MPYRFSFDLSGAPRRFFVELARLADAGKLHRRMGKVLRDLVNRFKIDELTGLEFSDLLVILEDLVDIQVKNLVNRPRFLKTGRRALLLPHCARKYVDSRCKAVFDPSAPTFRCQHCSPDCQINQATRLAEEAGYDVYILPGGSCIPKILEEGGYEGVVGVACGEEIKLAHQFLEKMGVVGQSIPLLKNGCANTCFNLQVLAEILNLDREHGVGGGEVHLG